MKLMLMLKNQTKRINKEFKNGHQDSLIFLKQTKNGYFKIKIQMVWHLCFLIGITVPKWQRAVFASHVQKKSSWWLQVTKHASQLCKHSEEKEKLSANKLWKNWRGEKGNLKIFPDFFPRKGDCKRQGGFKIMAWIAPLWRFEHHGAKLKTPKLLSGKNDILTYLTHMTYPVSGYGKVECYLFLEEWPSIYEIPTELFSLVPIEFVITRSWRNLHECLFCGGRNCMFGWTPSISLNLERVWH